MNKEAGFIVDTEIEEVKRTHKKKKKKFNLVRFIRKNIIFIAAGILLIGAILFCSLAPVCTEYVLKSRVATSSQGKEIEFYNENGDVVKLEKYYNLNTMDGTAHAEEIYDLIGYTEYTYNKNGVDEIKEYYQDQLWHTTKHEYEGENLVKKIVVDSATGATESTETFSYDENGVLISSTDIDRDGQPLYRYDYFYENNALVKTVRFNIESDTTTETVYTYEKGHLVSETETSGEYYKRTTEYSYNDRGLLSVKKVGTTSDTTLYDYEFTEKKISIFAKIF